jgi:hypothetical protein
MLYSQMVYIDKELSELQKKKVDMIADKILDLNIFELRYFMSSAKAKL